jgi:hypothetical protein
MKRCIALAALLLMPFSAMAEDSQKPPEALDLVHQVERLAAGKPLPVVVVGDGRAESPEPVPKTGGQDLLASLQDISEAFSSGPIPVNTPEALKSEAERQRTVYLPFAFDTASGRVWTIASDSTWSDTTTGAPMPPFAAQQAFFYSLTKPQLAVATTAGLRWSDYTDRQRALLKLVLDCPWAATRAGEGAHDPGSGSGPEASDPVEVAGSDTPFPIEKCTLHLYLGFTTLQMPGDTGDEVVTYRLLENEMTLRVPDRNLDWFADVEAVPGRKLKPSDLTYDAPTLQKPLGLSGVTTVAEIVKAAGAASGLPLRVDARLADKTAFVGDAAIRAADALKSVAFALDGAWRRVGAVYLLTWDRKGLATRALEQRARNDGKQGRGAQLKRWQSDTDAMKPPDWLHMIEATLQPDPRAAVAPTPAQYAI